MASTLPVPRLRINAGELGEILSIINTAKDPDLKIVGNLFGLWTNSFNQPVVHLITGPGKRATVSKKTFSPDGVYHVGMKKYLEAQHGLLQIGIWCSGNAKRYPSRKCNKKLCVFKICTFQSRGSAQYQQYRYYTCEVQWRLSKQNKPQLAPVILPF